MAAESATGQERVVLAVAAGASFLTPFSGASTNVALPSIGRGLGMDAVALGWVAMAYLLAAAIALVPCGKLADIHGRKRAFTLGILVHTLASLLCGLSPSAGILIAGRALQGLGGALIFGTNLAILTSVFPPERRGAALGWNVAAVYLGLSLGPALGGVLTDQLGWRSVFHASAALGLAIAGAAAGLEGEWAEARGEGFDTIGAALYAGALAALTWGLSGLPATSAAALVAAGALGLVGFGRWELRVPSPLVDVALLLRNRVFAFSNLAALVHYSATFGVGFLLSLYLQSVKGLSAQAAGGVLIAQPLLMTAVSPFAGRLSDRVPSRVVASIGMGLTAIGVASLALVGRATSLAYLVACLVVLGCGFGLFSSPNTNAVMGSVTRRELGLASATLGTMRLLGQMLSMAIATLLLSLFVGHSPLGPERMAPLVAATRVAFATFAALCVLGTFASLARGRESRG